MFTLALNVFYVLVAYVALVILVAAAMSLVRLGRRVIEEVTESNEVRDSLLKEMKAIIQQRRVSLPSKDVDPGRILYGIPPGMYRVDPGGMSKGCIDELRRVAAELGIPVIDQEEMLRRLTPTGSRPLAVSWVMTGTAAALPPLFAALLKKQ